MQLLPVHARFVLPAPYLSAYARVVLVLCCLLFATVAIQAQCLAPGQRENFETSDGGWTTGGIASDWAWGTPKKPQLIALDGKKLWTTGGLTKSGYNDNELAWVQSPCYDFSAVAYPYVEFRFFCNTEKDYDGATFQYSTDDGITWLPVGSINDPRDCLTGNWFNTYAVKYVNGNQGWSGYSFWQWGYHPLPQAAHQSKVRFRFLFGAGSVRNNYDGFAFDEFYAGKAPPTTAYFNFTCDGGNKVTFKSVTTGGCLNYLWNFGDSASGPRNTSQNLNPEHIFSGPGQYKVTFTTSGYTDPATFVTVINIIDPRINILQSPTCFGSQDGVLAAVITPAVAGASYLWSTTPAQSSDTARLLSAGTYRVSITAPNTCPVSDTITLTEPTIVSNTKITDPTLCNKSEGAITLGTTGGTAPYTYSWSPAVSNTNVAKNLAPGTYSIVVKDVNGCDEAFSITVVTSNGPGVTIAGKQDPPCWGNQGTATATATGGAPPYSYRWLPTGSTGATATFSTGGQYKVVVTDNNGCHDTATTTIVQPPLLQANITSQHATCGYSNGKAGVTVSGGISPYTYQWTAASGSTFSQPQLSALSPQRYDLVVTDQNGCRVNGQVEIAAGASFSLATSVRNAACFGNTNGEATVSINGGTTPYSILWSNGAAGTTATGLGAGTYTATVTDASGCAGTAQVVVTSPPAIRTAISKTDELCGAANGRLEADVQGGAAPLQYLWLPGGATTAVVSNVGAGSYHLGVTDANGCTDSAMATVANRNPLRISLGADTAICSPAVLPLSPGNYASYLWQDGERGAVYTVTSGGRYSVTVVDSAGCTANASINVVSDCGEVYFPSSFTPNGDGRNDAFGPLGNLTAISGYELTVYNRWGQVVFRSNNPREKWHGQTNGNFHPGTYVWFARYTTVRHPGGQQKGTVLLIR